MADDSWWLICQGRPPSAKKTNASLSKEDREFLASVRCGYKRTGPGQRSGLFYGVVYWFTKELGRNPPDADNISKKIWDKEVGLGGVAYDDDKRVRLRIAGIVDVGQSRDSEALATLDVLELPGTPPALLDAVGELIDGDASMSGFTYIEVGRWTPAVVGRCLRGAR